VEVKYKSSAMNVTPEQKPNRITNAHFYSVSPTCTKPLVVCRTSSLQESVVQILKELFILKTVVAQCRKVSLSSHSLMCPPKTATKNKNYSNYFSKLNTAVNFNVFVSPKCCNKN